MKKDIFKLPKRVENESLTAVQKTIIEACNIIENANASDLIVVNKDAFTRKELDELLALISEKLHATSMSLTNMYFNHSDKQIQLTEQNFTL